MPLIFSTSWRREFLIKFHGIGTRGSWPQLGTTVGRFKEASSYGSRGDVEHVLPFGGPFLTAELSVVVVGRQSVVPAALNVQRDQVQAELGRPLEEPVAHLRSMETLGFYSVARRSRKAHLVGEGHVHALRRLDDQTAHQRLDAVLFVEFERLELVPVQLQVLHLGSERRERPGGGRDQSSTAQTDEKKTQKKTGRPTRRIPAPASGPCGRPPWRIRWWRTGRWWRRTGRCSQRRSPAVSNRTSTCTSRLQPKTVLEQSPPNPT